jgi:hypothetical protein
LTEVDIVFLKISFSIMEQEGGWFMVSTAVRKWWQSCGDVVAHILVNVYQHFRRAFCLHHHVSATSSYLPTFLQPNKTPGKADSCNFAYLYTCLSCYL